MAKVTTLGEALGPSLSAGPVPTSGPELVRYAGGRRALAEQLSGMSGPPGRKSNYPTLAEWKAAETRWKSAQRQAQRWDDQGKPGKQTRGQGPAGTRLSPERRRAIKADADDRKWLSLYQHGMRARLYATIRVPTPNAKGKGDTRPREMPAGGPGSYIDKEKVRDILAEAGEDEDIAAEWFLDAFWEAYAMPEDTEVVSVEELKIWPEGTREP